MIRSKSGPYKPENLNELKRQCKDEWFKVYLEPCQRLIKPYWEIDYFKQLLLITVATLKLQATESWRYLGFLSIVLFVLFIKVTVKNTRTNKQNIFVCLKLSLLNTITYYNQINICFLHKHPQKKLHMAVPNVL